SFGNLPWIENSLSRNARFTASLSMPTSGCGERSGVAPAPRFDIVLPFYGRLAGRAAPRPLFVNALTSDASKKHAGGPERRAYITREHGRGSAALDAAVQRGGRTTAATRRRPPRPARG